MNDLISRKQAIELIKNYCENGCDIAEDNWCPSCQQEQFIELLKDLPSAQHKITNEDIVEYCRTRCMVLVAGELYNEMVSRWSRPEITYCKNCKFTDGEGPIADGRYWCALHESFMYFCSDAERRTDDGE